MSHSTRILAAFVAAPLLISSLACGLFEEDALDITYTEAFDFEVPVDANDLCQECSDVNGPAPMEIELQPIEFAVDIDIVTETGQAELADYAGRFKSVNITRIEYQAVDNALTFDLPELKLYLGPLGSEDASSEGVLELATIPSIAAGDSAEGNATINAANAEGVSDYIKSLQTAAVVSTQPKIAAGQDVPPSGDTELKLTVYVTLVANPADAISSN